MPTRTNHQLAAYALHQAFLVQFVADLEERELDFASDSEDSGDDMDADSSSDSSTSASGSLESSDDSDDHDLITPAEIYVHHKVPSFPSSLFP